MTNQYKFFLVNTSKVQSMAKKLVIEGTQQARDQLEGEPPHPLPLE